MLRLPSIISQVTIISEQSYTRTAADYKMQPHSWVANPSYINNVNEILMVSVRIGERALPVTWRVHETKGNIGFKVQKELKDSVRSWLPEGAEVMLAADRFYGTQSLIDWC